MKNIMSKYKYIWQTSTIWQNFINLYVEKSDTSRNNKLEPDFQKSKHHLNSQREN